MKMNKNQKNKNTVKILKNQPKQKKKKELIIEII